MRLLSKRTARPEILRHALRIKQLEKIHGGTFAVISAYRWDEGMSHSQNKERNEEFMKALQGRYKVEPAKGEWGRMEKSFLIKDMPFNEAKSFAAKYNQEAFIHKDQDGPVVLYSLAENKAIPAEGVQMRPVQPGEKLPSRFRNVGLLYDFDFEKEPLPLSAGPVSWADLMEHAEKYQKALETKEKFEKPESKYQKKQKESA